MRRAETTTAPGAATDPPPRTVLLVDDNDELRGLMRQLLEEADCAVMEAEHGAAAFDLLQAGVRPDVLVTDLSMPVMNGLELLERVRTHPGIANVLIVVVTADPSAATSRQVRDLADAAIDKGSLPQLADTVRSLPTRAA